MQSPIEEVPSTTKIYASPRVFCASVTILFLVISMPVAFFLFVAYAYRDVRGFVQASHILDDPVKSRVVTTHLYVLDIFGNELVHLEKVDDMPDGYVTGEKHCLSPSIRCDYSVDDVAPSIYP